MRYNDYDASCIGLYMIRTATLSTLRSSTCRALAAPAHLPRLRSARSLQCEGRQPSVQAKHREEMTHRLRLRSKDDAMDLRLLFLLNIFGSAATF